MRRREYEIQLLEIRQSLREAEKLLRTQPCTDLLRFRDLIKLKGLVEQELIDFRTGKIQSNRLLIQLMGG